MPSTTRRYQGEIVEWNDEKRCGFIRPRGAGPSDPVVFLSAQAMASRGAKPKRGDIVVYEVVTVDENSRSRRLRTRLRATRVTFLGDDAPLSVDERVRGDLRAFGAIYMVLLAVTGLMLRPVLWVTLAFLALSVLAILQYGWDKKAAGKAKNRVPEANLQFVALLGGWPGAALAQHAFRHKTQKRSFQTTFRIVAALNVAVTGAIAAFFALGLG